MPCSARPEPEVATLAISVRARQGDRLLHQAVVTALYGSATIVRAVVIAVSFPRRRIFGAIVWRDRSLAPHRPSTVSATRSSAVTGGRSTRSPFLRSPASASRWRRLSSGAPFAPPNAPARSASISSSCPSPGATTRASRGWEHDRHCRRRSCSAAGGDGALPPPLDAGRVTLYVKARNGIWQLIRALGVQEPDVVLVPSYNCGAELDAVLKAPATARFYRVDGSARVDFDDLRQAIDARTRAVLVTHYFGLPQPDLAGDRGALPRARTCS